MPAPVYKLGPKECRLELEQRGPWDWYIIGQTPDGRVQHGPYESQSWADAYAATLARYYELGHSCGLPCGHCWEPGLPLLCPNEEFPPPNPQGKLYIQDRRGWWFWDEGMSFGPCRSAKEAADTLAERQARLEELRAYEPPAEERYKPRRTEDVVHYSPEEEPVLVNLEEAGESLL